jgi:hypothetical protein
MLIYPHKSSQHDLQRSELHVQYPGFHSFVALPRQDSSYVTTVTHEFMMSLCHHQDVSKTSSSEAFQEHKPKC